MGNKLSSKKGTANNNNNNNNNKSDSSSTTTRPNYLRTPSTRTASFTGSVTSLPDSASAESVVRNGRKFHNFTESTYWLPSDDEEMDRLVGQHFALKALFEGNVIKEIHSVINLEGGAKILDVGCGPGTWIMDMATEYLDNEYHGIDMAPVFPTDIRPPNVSFQVANVLESLPFEDNTFDLVNVRFFMLALRKNEWAIAMKEVYRVLKPGGCIQSLEGSMLEGGNEFVSWVATTFKNVMQDRGQEPYIAFEMESILRNANFKVLKCDKRDTDLSKTDQINKEFLWDICNIVKSVEPFLAGPLGVSTEDYPKFLQQFYSECQKHPPARWMLVITLGQKCT